MKIFKSSSSRFNKSSPGLTLVTAVMILAAVMAITFSISTLALKEIKASRQLVFSEPAFLAAEAGAETALFPRLRQLSSYANVCQTLVTEELSSGSSRFSVCSDLYDNPYIFATDSTNSEVMVLYDPLDGTNIAAGYRSITIHATSSTNLVPSVQVKIYDLDLAANPDICGPNPTCTTVAVGSSNSIVLNENKSYAVFLTPTSPGSVSGFIQGFDSSSNSVGIPSKNPKIQSIGSKDVLLRKLQVILKR